MNVVCRVAGHNLLETYRSEQDDDGSCDFVPAHVCSRCGLVDPSARSLAALLSLIL